MLRNRILLRLFFIVLLALAVSAGAFYSIYRSYDRLEDEYLEVNLNRVINALDRDVERLDEVNREWSSGGLIHQLITNPVTAGWRDVVIDVISGSFNVREVAFFDDQGRLIAGRAADPQLTTLSHPLDEDNALVRTVLSDRRLLQHSDGTQYVRGLAEIDGQIRMISSRPILAGPGSDIRSGTMVVLGYVDEAARENLSRMVEQTLDLHTVEALRASPDSGDVLQRLDGGEAGSLFQTVDRNTVQTYTLLPDFNGQAAFVLETRNNRNFIQELNRTLLVAGLGLIALFVLLIGYLLTFLDRMVLRRLQALGSTVTEITSGGLERRLTVSGRDEISAFGRAFNRLLDSLQSSQQELTHRATYDFLTGLLNRQSFEQELEQAIESGCRGSRCPHLLFIDLDRFKIINDSCGHMAGDRVLCEVAGLMKEQLRSGDVFGRVGGDEFAIILRECRGEDARLVAEKLRVAVSSFRFQAEGRHFALGASIGLVTLDDPDLLSQATALTIADAACSVAKKAGRNRIHVHQPRDDGLQLQLQQSAWVNRITEALDENRFRLHGQRILNLATGGSGVEILLRLEDEDGSLVPPGAFIPAAERFGLMNQIDWWVITELLDWLPGYREQLADLEFFSINLSGQSLSDADFLAKLQQKISGYPCTRGRLWLEITETAAIENIARTEQFIRSLRELGCQFCLDDFGAGMSSFSYLKQLPVQVVKVDGAFCRNMAADSVDRALVSSINEIGHVMNLRTVAEFIEDEDTLEVARQLGIDHVQGFHIHRPEPLDQLFGESPSVSATVMRPAS